MRISDQLKKKTSISFEVFPPKEDKPIAPLVKTLDGLYKFKPDFISCTYGARGTNKGRNVEVCESIIGNGHDVVAHFTCIGSNEKQIRDLIEEYISIGIENLLLLRGDFPEGYEDTKGSFSHANELISFVRDAHPDICIGAAAYPEKHVESCTIEKDVYYLKKKQDAGADFFITQLCHDVDSYYDFLEMARSSGITIPIIAGVLPILFRNGTMNMTLSNGCSIPAELSQLMGKYAEDGDDFRKAGKEYTAKQIQRFMELGVDGLHIYALNRYGDIKDVLNWAGIVENSDDDDGDITGMNKVNKGRR